MKKFELDRIEHLPSERDSWGRGPWNYEPDLLTLKIEGFPCIIARHLKHGYLHSFVGINSYHPLFKVDYLMVAHEFICHHDLSFSGFTIPVSYGEIINIVWHQDTRWWFGFHCGHPGDKMPSRRRISYGIYRNIEYVLNETSDLCEQLKLKDKK